MTERTFSGEQFRVTLRERDASRHILVVIEAEDDGEWYEVNSFSSHWLEEFAAIMAAARDEARTHEPYIIKGKQYGWRFK